MTRHKSQPAHINSSPASNDDDTAAKAAMQARALKRQTTVGSALHSASDPATSSDTEEDLQDLEDHPPMERSVPQSWSSSTRSLQTLAQSKLNTSEPSFALI